MAMMTGGDNDLVSREVFCIVAIGVLKERRPPPTRWIGRHRRRSLVTGDAIDTATCRQGASSPRSSDGGQLVIDPLLHDVLSAIVTSAPDGPDRPVAHAHDAPTAAGPAGHRSTSIDPAADLILQLPLQLLHHHLLLGSLAAAADAAAAAMITHEEPAAATSAAASAASTAAAKSRSRDLDRTRAA